MRDGIIRTLAAVASALALTGGCGQSPSGGSDSGQGEVQVVVVPIGDIIPAEGGADIPQELQNVIIDCQNQLEEGSFGELATDMERIAEETDDPAVEAAALLCGGIARVDKGEFEEGLDDLDAAEDVLDRFPPEIRRPLAVLLYRGQTVGHTSTGNDEAAREALDDLVAVAPEAGDEALEELCRAAKDDAACAPAPTGPAGDSTPSDPSPTEEPTTPTEAPSVQPTS